MVVDSIKKHLRVLKAYQTIHIKTAMEYRMNFFVQSILMILNDAMWLIVFYFLFSAFGTINGYDVNYAITLFGITALAYGILAVIFGNRRNLSSITTEGGFDYYLSTPIDELFHALISKSSYEGFGDILFGITVLAIFSKNVWIGICVSIIGAAVLLGLMIAIETLGFYLQRPRNATRGLHSITIGFSAWPIDVYNSAVKTVIYISTIAFISTVPYHIIVNPSWSEFITLCTVAFVVLSIGILLFKFGLRKYESGNLMNVRT